MFKTLSDFAVWSLLISIIHTAVESAFIGYYGVPLTRIDILLLFLGNCFLFELIGAGSLVLIGITGIVARKAAATRSWLSKHELHSGLCIALGYLVVGVVIVLLRAKSIKVLLPACVTIGACVAILLYISRGVSSAFSVFFGFLSISIALVSATFLQIEHVTIGRGRLFPFLVWPMACLVLSCFMVVALRRSVKIFGYGPSRGVLLAMLLLAVTAALRWLDFLPAEFRWFVTERPVTNGAKLPNGPNILILVLDTVRADHMDLFGYKRETMPFLRKFATTDCCVSISTFSSSPLTLPTHGSIFTGMYSSAHGAHKPFIFDESPPEYAYFLREDIPTVAEVLAKKGYNTVGISGNYGVLSSFGMDRGFAYYDVSPGWRLIAPKLCWLNALKVPGRFIKRFLPSSMERLTILFNSSEPFYRRGAQITGSALKWLDDHKGEPFFMFLNYFDAHDPYLPVGDLDEKFAPRPVSADWTGFPDERYRAYLGGKAEFTSDEIEYLKGQYDSELVYLDRQLLSLMKGLSSRGLYDDMLIFILGDHGEEFMEHGFLNHGSTLYQPQITVPLLVKTPKGKCSVNINQYGTMQDVDVFPTIMEFLNDSGPEFLQGTPWGRDRGYALSEAFCQFCGSQNRVVGINEELRRELNAVYIDGWKLIRSTNGTEEVYDLNADPQEVNNQVGANPRFEARAHKILHDQKKRLFVPIREGLHGQELLEKLRSLGYVQ